MAVEYRLSGGTTNTDPNGSLGGQMSTTLITTDVLENLFDNINRNEILVGRTEHRMIYVINTGAGHISGAILEILTNPTVSIMSLGLDPVGKGDGINNGVAATISTEDLTPASVKFFGEDIASADGPWDTVKLPLGLLKAGEAVGVWLKRGTESGIQQVITLTLQVDHIAATLPGEDVDDGGAIGELLSVTKQVKGTFLVGTARVGFSDVGTP